MALAKLLLQSYDTSACNGTLLDSIEALVNPENYSEKFTIGYRPMNAINDPAGTLVFKRMDSGGLVLKNLMVDGTGII
jgi:hypothetical protein